jgi:hypothetical protein
VPCLDSSSNQKEGGRVETSVGSLQSSWILMEKLIYHILYVLFTFRLGAFLDLGI